MRTDKLMKPSRVASALDCGVTQAKYKMRTVLGGWFEAGIGWRCTERAVAEYIQRRAKGAPAWNEDQSHASEETNRSSHVQPSAVGTGTATSELQTGDDHSAPSTSEPTTPKTAGTQQSRPIGTSKRAQQLVSWIESDPRGRSNRRLPRSPRSKSSPS